MRIDEQNRQGTEEMGLGRRDFKSHAAGSGSKCRYNGHPCSDFRV